MGFFENVRSKEDHKGKPNSYYEKLLNKDSKNWLLGYDAAMEDIKCLFSNLEVYAKTFLLSGLNPFDVECSVIESGSRLQKLTLEERNQITEETKIALAFYNSVEDWMENARNISVTGLIDAMDIEEYKKNYEKIHGVKCEDWVLE